MCGGSQTEGHKRRDAAILRRRRESRGATRELVYDAIDGERDYQLTRHEVVNARVPHRDADHHVADWLTYIEAHIANCKAHVYMLDETPALHEMRKVAALAVACLEYRGCPER